MAARDKYNERRASASDEEVEEEEEEETGDGVETFTDAEDGGIVKSHSEDVNDQPEDADSDAGENDDVNDDDTNRRRVRIKDEHAFEIKELRVSMQCDITAYLSPNSVQELGHLVAQSNEELLSDNMKKLNEALVELEAQHQKEIDHLSANHKQELEQIVQQANEQRSLDVSQAKEHFDLDLQEQLTAQRAEMLRDTEERMQQLKEYHVTEIDRLKAEFASKEQEDKLRHQQDLIDKENDISALYKDKLSSDIQLLKNARDERENVLEAKIEALTKQVASSTDEISSQHVIEMEKLRNDFASDKIAALDSVRHELTVEHNEDIARLNEEHEHKHKEEIDKLKQDHNDALREQMLLATHTRDNNAKELQEKHEQDLEQLQAAYKKLEDELTSKTDELETVNKTLNTEQQDTDKKLPESQAIVAQLKQTQAELIEKHDNEIAQMQTSFTQLKTMLENQTIELETLKSKYEETSTNLRVEIEEKNSKISDLQGKLELQQVENDEVKQQANSSYQNTIDTLNSDLQQHYETKFHADLARQKDALIAELKSSYEEDKKNLQLQIAEQHAQELAEIEGRHRQALQQIREQCAEEYRMNIDAEIAAVRSALELEYRNKVDDLVRQQSVESDKQLSSDSSNLSQFEMLDNLSSPTQTIKSAINGDGEEINSNIALQQLQAKHDVAMEMLKADYEMRTKMLEDALVAERQAKQEAVASLERYQKQNNFMRIATNGNGSNREPGDGDEVDGGEDATEGQLTSSERRRTGDKGDTQGPMQASTTAQLGNTESRDIWDLLEELPSSYENLLNPLSSRTGAAETWSDYLFQISDDGFQSTDATSPKDEIPNSDGFVGGSVSHDLFSLSTTDNYMPPGPEVIRLRAELEAKKAHINELNSYIEQLLVKIMNTTPRLLQAGQLAPAIK